MKLVNIYFTFHTCISRLLSLVLRPRMTKNSIKYLLSLSILLMGIYSMLNVSLHSEDILYSSLNKNTETQATATQSANYKLDFEIEKCYIHSPKKTKVKAVRINEEKEEDDELPSSKKHSTSATCVVSYFYTKTFGCLINQIQTKVSFYKGFTCVTSCRYLIFRVFRI